MPAKISLVKLELFTLQFHDGKDFIFDSQSNTYPKAKIYYIVSTLWTEPNHDLSSPVSGLQGGGGGGEVTLRKP